MRWIVDQNRLPVYRVPGDRRLFVNSAELDAIRDTWRQRGPRGEGRQKKRGAAANTQEQEP